MAMVTQGIRIIELHQSRSSVTDFIGLNPILGSISSIVWCPKEETTIAGGQQEGAVVRLLRPVKMALLFCGCRPIVRMPSACMYGS